MEAVLLGAGVGLVAGLAPGAFFTIVATTALERGLRQGVLAALVPLLTEPPVLLAAVLVLTRLPSGALRWVGMFGGALLLFMAWKVFRNARDADPDAGPGAARGRLVKVGLVGILSPDPWVFWFLIGGPLLLNRWHQGPLHGIAFAAAFLGCLVGARVVMAWSVARSRRHFNRAWYRRVLRGASAMLALLGVLIVWQSWEGNFQELIEAPERIEEEVGGGVGGPRDRA